MKEIMNQKAALYERLQSGEASEDSLSAGQRENLLIDFSRKEVSDPTKEPDRQQELVEVLDEFGRTRLVSKAVAQSLQEERDSELKPIGPQHYDATKEIRTKGVGFFQFTPDEEERSAQLADLHELRQNTVLMRTQSEKLQMERKHKLEERLRKVKERRLKMQGVSAPEE